MHMLPKEKDNCNGMLHVNMAGKSTTEGYIGEAIFQGISEIIHELGKKCSKHALKKLKSLFQLYLMTIGRVLYSKDQVASILVKG